MFKHVSKEEVVIPATMGHLRDVREFIEHVGKKHKYADKVINSFKLVVDEACTNIIRHGYMDIKDGKITVRAIIRRMSLTMVIIDQGKSFDPRQVKNPDLGKYVEIGKKGGLGIFMMRKLMDDIQYNLTNRGNELRLTKMRDVELKRHRVLTWFDSLSLRRKSFIITSVSIVLLTIATYFVLESQIYSNIKEEVFTEATAITKNYADINWEPLNNENDILLFENAKSVKENHGEMIRFSMVTTSDYEVMAVFPLNLNLVSKNFDLQHSEPIEEVNNVSVYQTSILDTSVYYFIAPIELKNIAEEPIGYAVLWIEESYIGNKASSAKTDLAILLLVGCVGATIGIGLLVTFITEPFHKLADWVRQVGKGEVDEDEIDIDARDEVGEIAHAFNEMTSKFREAQLSVIEQQRLRKELQVAQEIQQMLLPDDFPEVVGYDITSYYQSAKEVGGDLFDFMEVDDQSIGICVADVSGKGIPGSMVMTMIRTSLRLETRGNKNPADILAKVNDFVTDDIRRGMFVTMFYVIMDSRERSISFASAGHNPMILYRGKTKETYYLNPSGFPVGITLPDIHLFREKIQSDRIRLHPDDILILYTDGITEAMNANRELYGESRFLDAIRKYGHLDVVEFVKSIKNDILNFTGGFEQNDDITLVAIKENMAAVDVKVNTFEQLVQLVNADNNVTVAEACREAGISPTTFYRYRKIYNEGGFDLLREMLHGYTNLGLRHLSIEVKTKMYDVIREHPEFGPKKISDNLNTEKYGFMQVSPLSIYQELRRAKLNTKERRIAFVKRGGKQRLKAPGTPLLTLDGQVLVGFRSEEQESDSFYMPQLPPESQAREKMISAKGKDLKELNIVNQKKAESNNKDEKEAAEDQTEESQEDEEVKTNADVGSNRKE